MTTFSIGSMAVTFQGDDDVLVQHAHDIHRGWESEERANVRVLLSRDDSIDSGPRHPIATREDAIHHLAYWGWRARFNADTGVCEGRFGVTANAELEENRVRTLTRMLLGQYILTQGGLSFHASSMVKAGRGYLFVGPRGAGKTTSVLRWPGDRILGDEHATIRPEADGYWVYSTPYSGREGTQSHGGKAPLAGIFVLDKSEETWSEALSPASAFRQLVPHVIHVSRAREDNQQVCDVLNALVTRLPIHRLNVSLNHPVWPVVERAAA